MRFLFVGERPSRTALRTGASWKTGGLCATTLHEALRVCGLNPHEQEYVNLFYPILGPYRIDHRVLDRLRASALPVVALGQRVHKTLQREGIPHTSLIHPAARGPIRLKERYHAHVKEMLA